MSESPSQQPTPEDIVEMFPGIAKALEEVSRQKGISPADIQSDFWNRAVHSR
jgi:hypothetical protein